MQKEEYLIKNACYSPAKYYLCKQNNKRSLLGRKQRSQVARSFLNRYQFSCINKVTSLFSIGYTLINILACDLMLITASLETTCAALWTRMHHILTDNNLKQQEHKAHLEWGRVFHSIQTVLRYWHVKPLKETTRKNGQLCQALQ